MPTGNGPKMGELRRAQLVSTHGPGAVIDYLAAGNAPVSGVTMGLQAWQKGECRRIVEPVLERLLGVRALREPPVSIGKSDGTRVDALSAARFPTWQECPECDRLRPQEQWRAAHGGSGLSCPRCTDAKGRAVHVVPARLMVICEKGHLDNFPWREWIEHAEGCRKADRLRLASRGAGLRNLWVNCEGCGAGRSLRNAFTDVHRALGGRCHGSRPWLGAEASEPCDATPRQIATALRGSSNLYFPNVASVLTIPPWSTSFRTVLEEEGLWDEVRHACDDLEEDRDEDDFDRSLNKIARRLARALDSDAPDIPAARASLKSMLQRLDDLPTSEDDPALAFRREEWQQFREATAPPDETFEIRPELVPSDLAPWFLALVRVPRLREVRALRGFTRRYPPDGTGSQPIAPLSLRNDWLPAIATSGEGIFLALNEDALLKWEVKEAVVTRARRLHDEWVTSWRERFDRPDETPPQSVTPRSLLVHGLSHALMLELSISSGYGSASLQERLYVGEGDEPMAGVLIYTATSDAEGTLGGLEREGLPQRFASTVRRGIARLSWCSSDPLCMKGVSTTSDPLSGAACHSCLYVSETSCEMFNRSLDRAMLIGGQGVPGYFEGFAMHSGSVTTHRAP